MSLRYTVGAWLPIGLIEVEAIVMVILVLASAAVCAAALFFVLDRPVARNKGRNTAVSGTLLSLSVVALVAWLAYAAAAWSSS